MVLVGWEIRDLISYKEVNTVFSGERLKLLREQRDKTQKGLAKATGVSIDTVGRWESGDSAPNTDKLDLIRRFLNTTASYLMGETDDPSPADASKKKDQVILSLREGTGMSLLEASAFLGIEEEELQRIEEGTILLGAKDKKRIMRAYANYLADEDEEEEGQGLTPIQGGGLCGSEGSELSEVIKALAKDSLIRKSVRMMEDLTEEEKYKVFQYIQDQEYIARTKGKREA